MSLNLKFLNFKNFKFSDFNRERMNSLKMI